MNEENYWKSTFAELEQGKNVVLVSIIERIGSAPNVPGAKMFVMEDRVMGTVGGGNSEHQLLDRAQILLLEAKGAPIKVHLEHINEGVEDSSGMICSGSQSFALVPVKEKDKSIVREIIKCFTEAQPGILTISERGLNLESGKNLDKDQIYFEKGTSWTYQENVGIRDRLFIIGGGHVSLALSCIMEILGFHITVYDDREELPTMNANLYAHEKHVISYEQITSFIPEGKNIYVTIMTFGHKSDELVLEKIISKNCRYIGMLASASKKEQVFENLEKKGISKSLLDQIYSPIGLKIKSHTPEEIAISIAAEIIKVKNRE